MGAMCLVVVLHAQQEDVVRIGLYGGRSLNKAEVKVAKGSYQVVGDGKVVLELTSTKAFTFTASGDLVVVNGGAARYKRVVVQRTGAGDTFGLRAWLGTALVKHTVYPDNLIVRARGGHVLVVNEVELDRYVEGVTEAESGKGHEPEYYNVQAIIARTYALSNLRKHATAGFHLCDEVHCQAYHGSARFEARIPEAVANTRDQVLVDPGIKLITAAFHSNCGGHTLNSEHVWSKPLPYLVGRPDTFCLVMPHSHWERSFKRSEWLAYLKKKSVVNGLPAGDSSLVLAYFPDRRQQFFADTTSSLRMTRVRSDWGLKSAFFVIEEEGDSVRFTGRGFGHGVGLCQEGAMRMAQLGHDCRSILHFYYRDVHIIDRRHIGFFGE